MSKKQIKPYLLDNKGRRPLFFKTKQTKVVHIQDVFNNSSLCQNIRLVDPEKPTRGGFFPIYVKFINQKAHYCPTCLSIWNTRINEEKMKKAGYINDKV